jgi:hypothetical protein
MIEFETEPLYVVHLLSDSVDSSGLLLVSTIGVMLFEGLCQENVLKGR